MHRHIQRTVASFSKGLDVAHVLGSNRSGTSMNDDQDYVTTISAVCIYEVPCTYYLEISIRHLTLTNQFDLRSRTQRRKYPRSSLFSGPRKPPSIRSILRILRCPMLIQSILCIFNPLTFLIRSSVVLLMFVSSLQTIHPLSDDHIQIHPYTQMALTALTAASKVSICPFGEIFD